jgi:predicted negative regulator of RcsB-dependent stress response
LLHCFPKVSRFRPILLLLVLASALANAADPEFEPVEIMDPQYGEALFYFYQEDYFPAIVRVLSAQEKQQLVNHAGDAELLLGGMYLSYGHHLEAADIFERMLADSGSVESRNRTWFFLAKIWYQRGYFDKSLEALDLVVGELPQNLRREALMLRANILIERKQYDSAIALLQNWDGKTIWASYAKYNIGVALVRSGRVDEAQALLNEIGQMKPFDEEMTSLRDKANLALGYALLQDKQYAAAKAPLQRVRLEGPFSNKALLGVGWADAEAGDFASALVPWMELQGRDLLDSAVQESMLAIPYAMAKLDSAGQAADHYLNAIEAFYEEANRLDTTIAYIESGEMFDRLLEIDSRDSSGWYWQLEELPEGPEARYLFHLLATHEFQEGLKNFRDLNYLQSNLGEWKDNVDVFGNMLDTRKQAYEDRLPRVEKALSRADIEGMVGDKLGFDSTLNSIEKSHDWLALANESEFEMWGAITNIEKMPALQSDIDEAAEVRDKIQLLKGVLQWQLEREFDAGLFQTRRDLNDAGIALVESQRLRRQIDESMRSEALKFAAFAERVNGLDPRIDDMTLRVDDALLRQRTFLQDIAVGELRAQKQRIDTYTVQARFALAAIYDVAASEAEEAR